MKPLAPSQNYYVEGLRGALSGPPLCQETLISRTDDVSFSSLDLLITLKTHQAQDRNPYTSSIMGSD